MKKYYECHTNCTIPAIFQKAERKGLSLPKWQGAELMSYNGFSHSQRVRKWQALFLAITMGVIPKPTRYRCDICNIQRVDAGIHYHSEDYSSMSGHYPLCENCRQILHDRYQNPLEWNELIKISLKSQRWFTLLSCNPNPKGNGIKKVCKICIRNMPECTDLNYHNELISVCVECKESFFGSECESQIIVKLDKAIDLVVENHIYLKYALNVAGQRYSLGEAIRKTALAKNESSGKSVDIFSIGKRVSGSFKSRE